MSDLVTSGMLVCAIAAALAFGILAAHFICRAAFAGLRLHATSVANARIASKAGAQV